MWSSKPYRRNRNQRFADRAPSLVLGLTAVAVLATACGLESDGTRARSKAAASVSSDQGGSTGRFQTEVLRIGVQRPLFLLVDTATGWVAQRPILGNQKFRPVSDEPAPGADLEPKLPGRYDVKVTPGRRGSGLLRVDTVTGDAWFFQLGMKHAKWMELGRLAEHPAAERGQAETAPPSGPPGTVADVETPANRIELQAFKVVLLDPSQDVQLRIWTARQSAELYPAETAELATEELSGDDPRILVAIANSVELDAEGRVRSALESLASHADEAVRAAVEERIGSTR